VLDDRPRMALVGAGVSSYGSSGDRFHSRQPSFERVRRRCASQHHLCQSVGGWRHRLDAFPTFVVDGIQRSISCTCCCSFRRHDSWRSSCHRLCCSS
jgi:hypothetical protein